MWHHGHRCACVVALVCMAIPAIPFIMGAGVRGAGGREGRGKGGWGKRASIRSNGLVASIDWSTKIRSVRPISFNYSSHDQSVRPINRCDQSMRPTSRSVPTARPINQCNRPTNACGFQTFRRPRYIKFSLCASIVATSLERHLRASPFTVDVWRRAS